MGPLFKAIIKHVPQRDDDVNGPLQLQICSLDYSSYVGQIGIGRINRGRLQAGQEVLLMHGPDSEPEKVKINQVLKFQGLEHSPVKEAQAGDIVLINGVDGLTIGCTVTALEQPEALPYQPAKG